VNRESPNLYDISYTSPHVRDDNRGYQYCKTQENVVIVNLSCTRTDGLNIADAAHIATLPEGFRPAVSTYATMFATGINGAGRYSVWVTFNPNGSIIAAFPSDATSSIYRFRGTVLFVAAQ